MKDWLKRKLNIDAKPGEDRGMLSSEGHAIVSDRPVALPIGFKHPPTLAEQMRAMIMQVSREMGDNGYETIEDADDFDVGDDYDPSSPHELEYDPAVEKEVPREMHSRNFIEEKPMSDGERFTHYNRSRRKKLPYIDDDRKAEGPSGTTKSSKEGPSKPSDDDIAPE